MGLIQDVKVIWELKKAYDKTKEAYKMDSTAIKAGWKTSEFWLTVLTNIIAIVGSLGGLIPPQTATVILAVANGVYGIIRAITKSSASSTSVTATTGSTVTVAPTDIQ